MNKILQFLVGSVIIALIFSFVTVSILKVMVYFIPIIFVLVLISGIANVTFNKTISLKNKFFIKLRHFIKQHIINLCLEFWFAFLIGIINSFDSFTLLLLKIIKSGLCAFLTTYIVWAAIRFVVKHKNQRLLPTYLQLWNSVY